MSIENDNQNLDENQENEGIDQDDDQDTGNDGQDNDNNQDGSSDENKDKKSSDNKDEKEHNRQGFQKRQEQKTIKGVSRDEFEKLNSKVDQITEENADLKFRNAHPNISDETFNFIKAQAKGSGKNYDEVLENPIVKTHLETEEAKERNYRATPSPSSRTGGGSSQNDWQNMPSDEFQKKKEEILRRG